MIYVIYFKVFGTMPTNECKSWNDCHKRFKNLHKECSKKRVKLPSAPDITKLTNPDTVRKQLGKIKGHLVEFPLEFLSNESLAPSILEGMAPADIFN